MLLLEFAFDVVDQRPELFVDDGPVERLWLRRDVTATDSIRLTFTKLRLRPDPRTVFSTATS
jgi:hypothetical protein